MTEQNTKATGRALRLKQHMKQKKPRFVRSESWRYVRIKESWRRPRGLDHKMRIQYDGWPPAVNIGYRRPKVTRGLHPSGYREVLVHNAQDLKEIDPQTQAIRIAHTVGRKKRATILAEAKKKRITILNAKEARKAMAEEKKSPEKELEKAEEKVIEEEEKPLKKQDKAKKRKGETKRQ